MKILGYPDRLSIGGSHVVALTMLRALRHRGHEVLLYSIPGPLLEVARRDGIQFVARRALGHRVDPFAVGQLTRLTACRGVDVALSDVDRGVYETLAIRAACRRSIAAIGSLASRSTSYFAAAAETPALTRRVCSA